MQNALKVEIKRLCRRAFRKEAKSEKLEEQYQKQFEKRTGLSSGQPKAKVANYVSRHFDPAYCARNANFLAKTIWYKILQSKYEPEPAINYQIPKPDGTKRSIMAFSILDAAVANVFLRRVRRRNIKRLSPSSFAYHPDKNVFDAILTLKEFTPNSKLFAVQIDFEKFFDTIPHDYVLGKLDDSSIFSLTPHEKYVFDRFLKHRFSEYQLYSSGSFKRKRIGTPQGSSVSLILSNIANHDLDLSLSNEAGKFVRFADDVVAVCSDYQQAQLLEEKFSLHCERSGLIINKSKSPGTAIISDRPSEIRTYEHFDYLGYRFSSAGLRIPEKTINRIKTKISRLIQIYLIHYLRFGFDKNRASASGVKYDWDLLGCIYEIRNAMYGGLSEAELRAFINDGKKLPKMKGLMGFYCLLEDRNQLRELDGWLLSSFRRAMVARNQILKLKYKRSTLTPSNAELATGKWFDASAWRGGVDNPVPETKVPSFVLGWRASRKYYLTFGLEDVESPNYHRYSIEGGFDSLI